MTEIDEIIAMIIISLIIAISIIIIDMKMDDE